MLNNCFLFDFSQNFIPNLTYLHVFSKKFSHGAMAYTELDLSLMRFHTW